ncbi:response regulator [Pseudomonas alliivorans]|nr:response regulator [Pseudomonas alliivorans]MEE4681081.1 response regulator [Pseudomonas alliivorans]MEE4701016.1 response regulator [Pseudomonas alliivorans]MEE4715680.1 response regulator [Pseudomonas alliivorans]MEE4720364.1 response regulator [Pseudomonas alliivorans]
MNRFERGQALLRQRRVLAEFGELALISPDLDVIIDSACAKVGEALGTHLAKFVQITPDQREFWVRNGVGWMPGIVGKLKVPLTKGSPEWYSLSTNQPVISTDALQDNRFRLHSFQTDNQVKAFVNVIVYAPHDQRPIGIFQVDSRVSRAFSDSDVDFLRSYANLIAGCFERFRITDALKAAEARLRESERQYRIAVQLNPQIPWTADVDGTITSLDHRWSDFSGVLREQTPGQGWRQAAHPDDMPMIIQHWQQSVATLQPFDVQARLRKTQGEYQWYRVRAFPDLDEAGLCRQWYGTIEDINERVRLESVLRQWNDRLEERIAERTQQLQQEQREREAAEAKLRQSQKMEAVGQLTGGIAHDFNNLLGSLSASLELMQLRMDSGRFAEVGKYHALALSAVKRAAALTARLLAFSRLQPLEPQVLDPSAVVASMEDMIVRTMGPKIQVVCQLCNEGRINCDLNQLENALLNLSINARDAMPKGGTLTLSTQRIEPDEELARAEDLQRVPYLLISVADTGCGMNEEVLRRAFDPFFTTKKLGQGTGLGLSMIYGFTRQSGGQVRIQSVMGQGTTVNMYFPQDQRGVEKRTDLHDAAIPEEAGQGEVILIVDDETGVREIAAELLIEQGYEVHQAADCLSALEQVKKLDTFDLLITDIGLPGPMNGIALAQQLTSTRPDLKVLFITGYAEAEGITEGQSLGKVLSKPFSLAEFSQTVKGILGKNHGPANTRG